MWYAMAQELQAPSLAYVQPYSAHLRFTPHVPPYSMAHPGVSHYKVPAPMGIQVSSGLLHCHYAGGINRALAKIFRPLGWNIEYLGTPLVEPQVALFGVDSPSNVISTMAAQVRGTAHIYLNPVSRTVTVIYLEQHIQV